MIATPTSAPMTTGTTMFAPAATAPLTRGWRLWLDIWCAAVVLFGIVLAGAAFTATDAPTRALLRFMGGVDLATLDRALRFATALMGAVTIGWGVTVAVAAGAIENLAAADRRRAWRGVVLAVLLWCGIDSGLSIATGFGLNAVSNVVFVVALLVPLVRGRAIIG